MATKIKASNLGSSATTAITNIVTENSVDSALVNGLIDSAFTVKSTTDLSEGSNLYYTTSRGDSDTGDYIAGNRTYGNITTTGYIAGPATFTIDPAAVGDNTGTLVVAGNLQVDGTTTTINSTTMEVDDINITLASGAVNAAAANGAGITVDGASATITYGSTSDSWSFNKNVGIGTSSPSTIIHAVDAAGAIRMQNSAAIAKYIQMRSDSTNSHIEHIGGPSDALRINNQASGQIEFLTANTERVRITSAGNVGIGTSSPSRLMTVSYASGQADLSIQAASNNYAQVLFGYSGADNKGIISYYNADNSMQFYTNTTERMRITSGGNVGIGTANPLAKLHTYGADALIRLDDTNGGVSFIGHDATGAYWRTFTSDTHRFLRASGIESMRIDSSGNVGIGTAVTGDAELVVYGPDAATIYKNVNTGTGTSDGFFVGLAKSNGTDAYVYQRENTNMIFGTSDTERMRIDSSGNVCIGNSVANTVSNYSNQPGGGYVASDSHFEFATTSNRSAVEIGKNNANDGELITFRKQGTTVGNVSVTSSGTTYNTTSDIRLKIDIEPIADATDKVMAMNAVTHKWKDNPESDAVHGFIAQEMVDIIPEAVSQGKEQNDTWSMDYGRITPVIVAALQDALKEIDMLKNRIAELEAK
jgi:hypothetical protein